MNPSKLTKLSTSQPHLPTVGVRATQNKYTRNNSTRLNLIPENTARTDFSTAGLLEKNLIRQVEWSKEIYPLKHVVKSSFSSYSSIDSSGEIKKLPILVKIAEGSYGIIRDPKNIAGIGKKCINHLLFYHRTKSTFVLCQSIKFKDKKASVQANNISIPITYNGWFEILSEDGKSIKPLLSVKDLLLHTFNSNIPKKLIQNPRNHYWYILRENLTAYTIADSAFTIDSIGDVFVKSSSHCKTITIRTGDLIQIKGEAFLDSAARKTKSTKKLIKFYLKRNPKLKSSDSDDQYEIVYLADDIKGKFSPLARVENISGVHKLSDIVKKFRFPITVQLVYGRAPSPTSSSTSISTSYSNNNSNFSPILRLLKIYEEENVFAYPVGKESCLIQIPIQSNLEMHIADNMPELLQRSSYLQSILKDCKKLAPEYHDMIFRLPQTPNFENSTSFINNPFPNSSVGRAVLMESNTRKNSTPFCSGESFNEKDEETAYQEIDSLYQYVRTGILTDYVEPKYIIEEEELELKHFKNATSSLEFCLGSQKNRDHKDINISIPGLKSKKNFCSELKDFISKKTKNCLNDANLNDSIQLHKRPVIPTLKLFGEQSSLNTNELYYQTPFRSALDTPKQAKKCIGKSTEMFENFDGKFFGTKNIKFYYIKINNTRNK